MLWPWLLVVGMAHGYLIHLTPYNTGIQSFSHTILRPTIPLEMGTRFIHTPETLLLLHTPRASISLFRFKDAADAPRRIKPGNYSFINFQVEHQNDDTDLEIRMFTNQKEESHMVVLYKESPLCTVAFTVRRLGVGGHSLQVEGSYYGDKHALDLWKMQMFVILMGLTTDSRWVCVPPLDRTLFMGETEGQYTGGGSVATEDFYLRLYRKAVMRLVK